MATKRKKPSTATQVSIRIDEAVLHDADALIPMVTETTGLPATRVEVLRAAMLRGLRDMRREWDRRQAG